MAEVVFLVDIDADKATIHEALTTESGIKRWWTSDANVSTDVLDLGFPDAPARFSLRVDKAEGSEVEWTSLGEFPPHWVNTKVTWQLMDNPSGAGTQVFFTHGGFAAPDPMLGHSAYTWAQLMAHLKAYAESGTDNPFFG